MQRFRKSFPLRRQLKAYALAAAATVTVLASLTSERGDYARMDRELSDYHFAYYARSAEEIELYLENEMWYRYFVKQGEHDGDFYGLYGKSAEGGPTQEFRDALQLSEQPRDGGGILGRTRGRAGVSLQLRHRHRRGRGDGSGYPGLRERGGHRGHL